MKNFNNAHDSKHVCIHMDAIDDCVALFNENGCVADIQRTNPFSCGGSYEMFAQDVRIKSNTEFVLYALIVGALFHNVVLSSSKQQGTPTSTKCVEIRKSLLRLSKLLKTRGRRLVKLVIEGGHIDYDRLYESSTQFTLLRDKQCFTLSKLSAFLSSKTTQYKTVIYPQIAAIQATATPTMAQDVANLVADFPGFDDPIYQTRANFVGAMITQRVIEKYQKESLSTFYAGLPFPATNFMSHSLRLFGIIEYSPSLQSFVDGGFVLSTENSLVGEMRSATMKAGMDLATKLDVSPFLLGAYLFGFWCKSAYAMGDKLGMKVHTISGTYY